MTVTYNKNLPAIAQNDPFSCSVTSARWALTALGRNPSEAWIEGQAQADGIVSQALGLLDASGAGLAAWLGAQYAEFGFLANNEPAISFEWAAAEGGHAYPCLLGGRAWGHWTALRDYDAGRDLLLLANPADGWQGVHQTMSRAQFDALGPFSAVRIWHPDLLAPVEPPAPPAPPPAPEPPPLPPPPPKPSADEIRAGMRAILDLSDEQHVGRSIRAMLSDLYDRSV